MHCTPPLPFFGSYGTEPPAEPDIAPGVYLYTRPDENIVMLARHAVSGPHPRIEILEDRDVAAEIVRALGGNPAFLDTPEPNSHSDPA